VREGGNGRKEGRKEGRKREDIVKNVSALYQRESAKLINANKIVSSFVNLACHIFGKSFEHENCTPNMEGIKD
jgi:hypothetical protein